jgi:hypothetical protein
MYALTIFSPRSISLNTGQCFWEASRRLQLFSLKLADARGAGIQDLGGAFRTIMEADGFCPTGGS